MTREMWSTPYVDSTKPHRWLHVKTTDKRIAVIYNDDLTTHPDYFSRDRDLPEGAVGAKASGLFLFEDRDVCLRYMATQARKKAASLERQAARQRELAEQWDAEATP